jgi:hypothetical protein
VMMPSALAKFHVDADGSEAQAPPFYEMQQAMTGLMDLTYGKVELPNLPDLPHEFATKWPHNDVSATVVASSWNFLSRIATLFRPPNFISWTCSLFCLLTVRAVPQ